jgi:rhomboid protease GluP
VYYGNRSGSRHIHGQALSWALTMGILGFILPGVDNYAHAGGFVGGYVLGRALDPLKPEQINHIAIAVVCLGASVIAVIWSFVHAFVYFR